MNNTTKTIIIAAVIILALGIVGAGAAFAQTPTAGFGPGWMMGGAARNGGGYGMMGGYAQDSESWEWMNSMHQWMNASGGMHTFVWDAISETLGLTSDELDAELAAGKTIAQVAEEKGIARADLVAALETAHQDSLAQAVTDGYLTQEQADSILAQIAGRYEWMLDNSAGGYGMMGGRYNRSGANGQFTPGGCHGGGYNTPADQTTRP